MNEAARRSFLKAQDSAHQARRFKLTGNTKLMREALSDAKWHRDRARTLASN
jgi:ribosomal protein L35